MMQRLKKITIIATLCIAILMQNVVAVHAAELYEVCPGCGGMVIEKVRDTIYIEDDSVCPQHTKCIIVDYYAITYIDVDCETTGCSASIEEIEDKEYLGRDHFQFEYVSR